MPTQNQQVKLSTAPKWELTPLLLIAVRDLGQFFYGRRLDVFQPVHHSLHVYQLAAVSAVARSSLSIAVSRPGVAIWTL